MDWTKRIASKARHIARDVACETMRVLAEKALRDGYRTDNQKLIDAGYRLSQAVVDLRGAPMDKPQKPATVVINISTPVAPTADDGERVRQALEEARKRGAAR